MNRQVPSTFKYLILGSGKLAINLAHYFDLLQVPYQTWSRSGTEKLSRSGTEKLSRSGTEKLSRSGTQTLPSSRTQTRSRNSPSQKTLCNTQFADQPISQKINNDVGQKNIYNNYTHTGGQRYELPESLQVSIEKCSHLLLAISDSGLREVIEKLPKDKIIIHFSGSLSFEGAYGLHPLMTFTEKLYGLDFYKKIPFVVEKNKCLSGLKDLISEFENPWTFIEARDKALYHAMCVVGGNFTNILWREVHKVFSQKLNIPSHFLKPYIEATFQNLIQDPQNSLTGPLQRNDQVTIEKNLEALNSTGLATLYQEFVSLQQEHAKEFST